MSKINITGTGKIIIIALIVGGIFSAKLFWWDKRPQTVSESMQISKIALPDAPEASLSGNAEKLGLPSNTPIANDGRVQLVHKIMAWNSQFGWMYANGGATTTKGSLFDNAGVHVTLVRQDDCNKSCADLVAFANAYKDDPKTPGVCITFMGDGMGPYMTGLASELSKLGPDYRPIIVMTSGKSYGEDKLMAPASWLQNPKNAIGKCVACVIRDGDMNILLKWAADNNIKVNPDETTYDPDAINLIAAANSDFVDAGNKYITGYTETRKVVANGKTTGRDTTVGVDAVSSWSPVDANIAEKKGGLVCVVSTKEYSTQMPNMTIMIKKWAYDHMDAVTGIISSLAQAGDQIRSFNDAKQYAASISAEVYGEKQQGKDAAYWLKLYNGYEQNDVSGLKVRLGGSMVFNLADMANTFGLGEDRIDRYKIVYETFAGIMSKMYPKLLPTYLEYSKAVDKTFVSNVISNHPELLKGNALKHEYAENITKVVSNKSVYIQFEVGSAVIKPESYPILLEAFKSTMIGEGLKMGIYGYTDNTGSDENNLVLSKQRAEAVKQYLIKLGLAPNSIESDGYGSSKPIGDNSTEAGRKQNRRVEIVLGN